MLSHHAPEALDRTLQELHNDHHRFGGVTMVFGGDFQQVLPVIPRGSREMIVHATLCKSPIWRDLLVFHLTQNMHLENGAHPEVRQFAAWLLDLGHGRNQHSPTHAQLPQSMVISRGAMLEDLIAVIYSNISTPNQHPDQYFSDRMILAPHNADVHDINDRILEKFPGEETIYDSADSAVDEEGVDHPEPIPVEYLNSINASGLPCSKLALKVGSPILLLCNLSVKDGLCNGTHLHVEHLGRWVIQAHILGGFHHGKVAFIPRMMLTPSDLGELNFILKWCQFLL